MQNRVLFAVVGWLVNMVSSFPFVILLVALVSTFETMSNEDSFAIGFLFLLVGNGLRRASAHLVHI